MSLKREPPVNFTQIILEIRSIPSRRYTTGRKRHSFTFGEIAAALGISENTIKGWFYSQRAPSYEGGRALLQLHEALTQAADGRRTIGPPKDSRA